MKDMFGNELSVGDIVCYYQSNKGLSMFFSRVVQLQNVGAKVVRLARTSSEGCQMLNEKQVSTIKSGANALIIRDQQLIQRLTAENV